MDEEKDIGTRILDTLLMLAEKVDNLEVAQKELYDEVINPIRQGKEEMKFQDFKEKYSDELEPYAELSKYTEDAGEDYDIYRDTYDKTREVPEEEMDDTILKYTDILAEKFDNLRAKLGIDPEADIEVKSDAEGQTEVEIKEDEAGKVPSDKDLRQSEGPAPAEPSEVKETEEITEEAVPEEDYDDTEEIEELRKAKEKIYE